LKPCSKQGSITQLFGRNGPGQVICLALTDAETRHP